MTRIISRLTDAIACAALLMWLLLVPRSYWDDADAWDDGDSAHGAIVRAYNRVSALTGRVGPDSDSDAPEGRRIAL